MLPTVHDLKATEYKQFRDERGVLVPVEMTQAIPFQAVRMFWVHDVPAGSARGSHAHKVCLQYMICVAGLMQIDVYDGHDERSLRLASGHALFVPATIFATERFDAPGTILMVFCDRPYERDDYIADRDALALYRRQFSTS